jgi:hypothetical protein
MKHNTVRATGITGIYKDAEIEIDIGQHSHDTQIRINGKKVQNCTGVWIKMRSGEPTRLFLEFVKHGGKQE